MLIKIEKYLGLPLTNQALQSFVSKVKTSQTQQAVDSQRK